MQIGAGAEGDAIFAAAAAAIGRLPDANAQDFVARKRGLANHETPRPTGGGPISVPGSEAFETVSVDMSGRRRLVDANPDTVVVAADGWPAFGDRARGRHRGGIAA
jgi:hypothetical protein